MWFARATPASLIHTLANGRATTMTGPSSPTSRQPLAFYDPASCALKMCQGILLWGGLESLERLPAWGMTTSDGVLSGRATPALLISVRDGSALPALPTPRTSDTNGPGVHGDGGLDLRTAAALLPTPRAQNAEPRNTKPWIRPLDQPQNLENAIARLLPTPVVNDMGRGKTVEEWDSWTDEMKERHDNGNGHGASLEIEILRLLPTPTSVDAKVFGPNIDWEKRRTDHAPHTASVLMNLQSNDGNTSLDEQPPPQSTTED